MVDIFSQQIVFIWQKHSSLNSVIIVINIATHFHLAGCWRILRPAGDARPWGHTGEVSSLTMTCWSGHNATVSLQRQSKLEFVYLTMVNETIQWRSDPPFSANQTWLSIQSKRSNKLGLYLIIYFFIVVGDGPLPPHLFAETTSIHKHYNLKYWM